jgi:hypothetical protein
LFVTVLAPAQDVRLPRDPQKLLERAQRFWTALASGQRLQAAEFVLPEKKESFVSGNPLPVLSAKVLAVNVTSDPTRASVQIGIDVLGKDLQSPRSSWTITDVWVWRKDNWYADVGNAPALFTGNGPPTIVDREAARIQLEKNFHLVHDRVDLGELIEGQYLQVDVPIQYAGDGYVSIDSGFETSLATLDSSSAKISSSSTRLILQINTEGWDGPFDLPLPLKIKNQAATIERTLVVHGNVLAPILFRQEPPDKPIEVGHPVSVFIKNNTNQQVGVRYVSVDAKFEILRQPAVLVPSQEAEVALKLKPNASPDRLVVVLDRPLYGRDTYSYRFRN